MVFAECVKLGDFIMGFGRVADIRRFEGSVAFFTQGGQQLSRGCGEKVETAEAMLAEFTAKVEATLAERAKAA
jgi:hypothetical protein